MLKRLALLILLLPVALQAQSWSGILDSSRAYDWTTAGVVPATRTTICFTETSSRTFTQINADIAACPAGQYVLLQAGTYNLGGALQVLRSDVTVRGAGADQTFLVPTAGANCNGLGTSAICIMGSNSGPISPQNSATWTAGFTKGATTITLSNTLNITAGSTLVTIDQLDEAADTGTIWNCLVTNVCSNGGSGGGARGGNRSQQQTVLVTACSTCNSATSQTVTISPGLAMPNWALAQTPGAFWATTTIANVGIENLSIDNTSVASEFASVLIMNCYGCWATGNRSIKAGRAHFLLYESAHNTIQSNYLYENADHGSTSYAIEVFVGSDHRIENNICDQTTDSCPSNTAGGVGNVGSYNHTPRTLYTNTAGWLQAGDYAHASGDSYWLREGESSTGLNTDNVHGTHHFTTAFRNYFTGWQPACSGISCNTQTVPIQLYAGSRYANLIGNVLGASPFLAFTRGETVSANNQNFTSEAAIQSAASATSTIEFSPQSSVGHGILSILALKASGGTPATIQTKSACDMFNSATTLGSGNVLNVAAGSALVFSVFWDSITSTITAADADGAATISAPSKVTNGSDYSIQSGILLNSSSGTKAVTVTFSSAASNKCIIVHEISHIATSNGIDVAYAKDIGAVAAGTHTIQSGNASNTTYFTTTQAGDYIYAAGMDSGFSGGSSWLAGTAHFQDNYASTPTGGTKGGSSINTFGWTGNSGSNGGTGQFCINAACASKVDYDTLTTTYSMRWGNYDVVNAAARWESSEVPSAIALYSNALPASQVMPASFYLAAQPSWWPTPYGTPAYPAIGDDVTGGSISGYGGRVYKIPSQLCYDNMATDGAGDGQLKVFNAATCYGYNPAPATTGAARTRVHR